MPTDYLQILRGITGGLEAGQKFRANRQLEKARDQSLESGEYDLQERRAARKLRDPATSKVLGELDPTTVQDYEGLGDPFAFKIGAWFKSKFGKKRQALPAPTQEEVGPPAMYAQGFQDEEEVGPPQYADGGKIPEISPELAARLRASLEQTTAEDRASSRDGGRAADQDQARAQQQDLSDRRALNRSAPAQEYLDRTDAAAARKAAADAEPGMLEKLKRFAAASPENRAKVERNAAAMFAPEQEPAPAPARTALPVGAPPALAQAATQQPAAGPAQAVPTGAARAAAPAGPRTAVPAQTAQPANMVDFSQLDADPKDVPNMTTDDWVQYRAKLVDAARQSGRPERVQQVNQLVTQMQQEGFLAYGQQGLALQQAGNVKGAMGAYRAAFQYFPNGNDVEFGTMKGQIVGFGRDEKTGKVVPGSELVMDPERVAKLIENFKNPDAFRAWTKDWRDFEEGKRRFDKGVQLKEADDKFREREYNEVRKPLAQAQADSLANNSEANITRALNTGKKPLTPRDLQGSERTFRQRLDLVGLTDEASKDYLSSVMSQIKQGNPDTPDNAIIDAVMKAQRDGTLPQRLKAMGIQ